MMMLIILIAILVLIGGGIWGWPVIAGVLGLSAVTSKPGALKHIAQLMNTYDIKPSEVEDACLAYKAHRSEPSQRSKGDIARTLFSYLGAVFILAGIGTYIGMFWGSMGSAMRIFVTLGTGYALMVVLISALQEKKYPGLIIPLTAACLFMMTSGWFVLLHELFPRSNDWRGAALFVFGVMALQMGLLFGKYRLTVFVFTTLFFVYGFMQVGLDMLGASFKFVAIVLGASLFLVGQALEKTAYRVLAEPALLVGACWLNSGLFDLIAGYTDLNWASLLIGVSLMLTAYGLQKEARYSRLSGLGYFVGSVMAYSGLFDLLQHSSVELLFLAATASVLYACVVLQSRALLLTTVIAMLGYIGYYSAEHFANSLGWPVTLIFMGVAFLGVGTLAIKVKQRI